MTDTDSYIPTMLVRLHGEKLSPWIPVMDDLLPDGQLLLAMPVDTDYLVWTPGPGATRFFVNKANVQPERLISAMWNERKKDWDVSLVIGAITSSMTPAQRVAEKFKDTVL